jgi:hypothetical protein
MRRAGLRLARDSDGKRDAARGSTVAASLSGPAARLSDDADLFRDAILLTA